MSDHVIGMFFSGFHQFTFRTIVSEMVFQNNIRLPDHNGQIQSAAKGGRADETRTPTASR
jgi:hypothetical protein